MELRELLDSGDAVRLAELLAEEPGAASNGRPASFAGFSCTAPTRASVTCTAARRSISVATDDTG